MKIVLVTGGFDPLHSGHIEYFKAAKQLGNLLVVGINSDEWLARKKGKAFMPASERKTIIENLYQVHRVIEFDDSDGSGIDAIRQVKAMFPRDQVVFANGGDRTKDNIPEMVVEDVEFVVIKLSIVPDAEVRSLTVPLVIVVVARVTQVRIWARCTTKTRGI